MKDSLLIVPYYATNRVTLYHGDSLEILPRFDPGQIDLLLTDTPFAVSKAGSVHKMARAHGGEKVGRIGRRLDFFEGDTDWASMTALVRRVIGLSASLLAPHGSLYVWTGHRIFGGLVEDLEGAGWSTRFLVWAKAHPVPPPPGAGWPSGAELCLYAYRSGRKWRYTPRDVPRSNVFVADAFRHGQPGKTGHPTQKPLGVIDPLLLASTDPDDLVLDPFCGSGTTLVSALRHGRRAIGIERDERYCEMAARRLQAEEPAYDLRQEAA